MYGFTTEPTPQAAIGSDVLPFVYRWNSPRSPDVVVPVPFCRFENFLGSDLADGLLSYAVSRQADFTAGMVMDPLTGQLSHKGRDSLVLPAQSAALRQHLADCLPQVSGILGVGARPSTATTVFTAHGPGSYFDTHTDATKVSDPGTSLSAVYYLHRRPRGFDGGQLRMYDTAVHNGRAERAKTYRVIEPDHDTVVFFPSSAFHEVTASTCPTGQFHDYRFTLTTWLSSPSPEEASRPQNRSHVLHWMAQAAEHTRPLPGIGRAQHGATPSPLPTPTAH
ncbi:2OG-Fe(II) oxygenase [Streptomyces cinnamoneus]|uniref:2OG-Fe(II) oxygenase n=1 Tax=Streptomyces cinnamoneus TaxID=53446 RepID=UPI0034106440